MKTKKQKDSGKFVSAMKRIKQEKWLLAMALPGLAFLLVFNYLPMFGIILPFINYDVRKGFFGSDFVGFENFRFLFENKQIWQITANTVGYNLIFTFLTPFIAIILALILTRMSKKYVKLYQTCFFVPYFVSWVVVSYVVFGFLNMEHGFVNTLLTNLGKEPILWYNTPEPWPFVVILSNTWKAAGYDCIIYYTALIGIDKQLYESAEIDGASRIQQILYISIPAITPVICLLVILSIGSMFVGNFDLFYNLARDSAATYPTMDILDTYVYRALKQIGDIGMSSAACVFQSVVGFILVLLSNLLVKKINPDYALF